MPSEAAASGCPFSACSSCSPPPGEAVDPRNMMPVFPQTPAAAQSTGLSKERATSSIPMADEPRNWMYPSPQQFYHALLRKNKGAEADAMDAVVHVHNVTNERTWNLILDWERMHQHRCPTPSLLRFVGRQSDLSFGAWVSSYRMAPFDRHDWFVDRCGLKTVRYVIDYYDDPHSGADDGCDISIVARPAVDSLGALIDRLRRPGWQAKRMWAAVRGGGSGDGQP
mmetsp:Transcript_31055/g.89757  ORF Transcript_31055/g.89757 Transcript_31055/m.89757 type:complete len:225 (+) Transcript_31055:77-751(+)